jgi:hypothetical protein
VPSVSCRLKPGRKLDSLKPIWQSNSRPQWYVSKFELGERRLDVIEFLDVAQAIGFEPFRFLKKVMRGKSSPKTR